MEEADLSQGRLSSTAPLARALMGKAVGDYIEVPAPGGVKGYEVVKVVFV
jgi:transcription elongation factor GreA